MAAHQAPLSLISSRQEHWSGLPFPSPMYESENRKWSHSVMSDSLRPHGLQPTRILCPWDFPGKSTGVGCHCLLQIKLLHCCKYLSNYIPLVPEWILSYGDHESVANSKHHETKSTLSIHWKDWCWSWSSNIFHLMERVSSLEKTLMLGKIEGRRGRGWQRMRWLNGITDSMDTSLSKLRE